ncbi:MAG: PIN domain-containing protein [Gemmataceae bacterium]
MPQPVMVDAGPFIALFNRDDRFHAQALALVKKHRGPLLSTLAVVTEVMYVLDELPAAQADFLTWVSSGAVELVEPENADLQRVVVLMKKYADLPMDFTDGVLVALCERLNLRRVASVDRHFSIYRPHGTQRFTNVFPAAP